MLNVDKPEGITSMDVLRRIKRASGQKRVGHGGTLDPFATGVIPVCFGQATRMMEYLIDGTRVYRAVVELGVETDTYDSQGAVTSRADASGITRQDLEVALAGFMGVIEQVPPMYSALKREGKRLYELARAGIEVDRKARRVEVFDIDFKDWSTPQLDIEVHCGRGFYVRSLAYDLGRLLGCGGHLKSLVRLRSGPFDLSEALSLEQAERCFEDGSWKDRLHPPDMAVDSLRAIIVGGQVEEMIRHGRPLPAGLGIPESRRNERCRVYSLDGRFLALMSFNSSTREWKSNRVFNLSYESGEQTG
jgi:tRNA pseudouridine55 synthase